MRLLMIMALSMLSNNAIAAEPGRFTFLGLNQCAPFEGVLFNPTATAMILSDKEIAAAACETRLKYELDLQSADYDLRIQNLEIRQNALLTEYQVRVDSLERESDALANALKKQSRKNPALWAAIGVIGGITLSYSAYSMSK
jgi:hypothetical protein